MRDHDVFLKKALLETGVIDASALDEGVRRAQESECDLGTALLEAAAITARQLCLVKADICEVPFVDVSDYEVRYENSRLLPRSVAERFCVFPLFLVDGVLTLGTDDPMNLAAMDQVRQIVKCEVDAVLCEREKLLALMARAYSLSSSRLGSEDDPSQIEIEEDSDTSSRPIVAAVNQLLADAAEQAASDIHINPDEHELRIRYRIDGVLREKQGPPLSMHAGIVQRLKVIANLDLTQTRRPQDGKFRFRHRGEEVEVRMSTLPTVCGENVVLRLLANRQSINDFTELGVPPRIAADLEEILTQPNGMLLVTGPTGSGKTTTLYTAINRINDPSRNIITIEDPVEIRLPYVRQVQVNPEIGLTFASALRSILRQDPDVVLVGEIRDNETATIALQSALTGHLVLSTLHTNDAAGAIARLRDFGLPPFVINSAVLGVVAQRLLRRICTYCVVSETPDELVARRFGLQPEEGGFSTGRGCTRCGQTGFRGRLGCYEFFRITREIQRLIEAGESVERIRERAIDEGMRLMWQDGLEKARLGLTTLSEVVRAASLIEVDVRREAA